MNDEVTLTILSLVNQQRDEYLQPYYQIDIDPTKLETLHERGLIERRFKDSRWQDSFAVSIQGQALLDRASES